MLAERSFFLPMLAVFWGGGEMKIKECFARCLRLRYIVMKKYDWLRNFLASTTGRNKPTAYFQLLLMKNYFNYLHSRFCFMHLFLCVCF